MDRPTGIIRTIISFNNADSIGAERYRRSVALMEKDRIEAIYISLQAMPKFEVLHLYLLVNGEIQVRFNIAGYIPGEEMKCWDNKIRKPKYWAICTAPVSRPPEPIKRRGFQGFRYTTELW